MALKQRIGDEMKAALLGGNRFLGDTLRNLNAAILDEEVKQNKRNDGLSDEAIEKVIAHEVKKRRESAAIYRENNRVDLAEPEEKEMTILQAYLPEQMTEAELQQLIDEKIVELGVSDLRSMGQVVGAVKAAAGNKADGAMIANLAKQALTK